MGLFAKRRSAELCARVAAAACWKSLGEGRIVVVVVALMYFVCVCVWVVLRSEELSSQDTGGRLSGLGGGLLEGGGYAVAIYECEY